MCHEATQKIEVGPLESACRSRLQTTADTFIKFIERLIKDAERKIFLIIDNLKVHHSYKVGDWLQEHKDQIEVFFLPSEYFV